MPDILTVRVDRTPEAEFVEAAFEPFEVGTPEGDVRTLSLAIFIKQSSKGINRQLRLICSNQQCALAVAWKLGTKAFDEIFLRTQPISALYSGPSEWIQLLPAPAPGSETVRL